MALKRPETDKAKESSKEEPTEPFIRKTTKKTEPNGVKKAKKQTKSDSEEGEGMTNFIMRKIQEFFEGLLDKTS